MTKKIRWGVLGAANIAVKKVIPSMQKSEVCEITAIASRSFDRAETVADKLEIKNYYGSYEELLADATIDAIYNPLPNHLHLEWTRKAAEAGKHVLCEKPITLNADEVRELIKIQQKTKVKIQEAFMVRTHPVWKNVFNLIHSGKIGELKTISGFFSYFNDDNTNIRNKLKMGGGAMMDIGCYCTNISRFIFGDEPERVSSLIERDEETEIDKITSAIMDFSAGKSSTFTCSTQLVPYQRMQFFGTKGRLEVQIPFNIPPDTPTKIFIDDGSDLYGESIETIEFEVADQYLIQGDRLSKAILENSEQGISLEDSFANMAVIDAIFLSSETNNWETPRKL